MTVISQNVSVTYVGTGTVGPFAFNFPISSSAAIRVIQNLAILPSTAYIVTPVNNNYDNGGSVLLLAPCPVEQPLTIQRFTPITQTTVYTDNLPQPMKTFENSLDKVTEILQEITAGGGGSGSQATYVVAGNGITVTGTGTLANPYVISTTTGFTILSFTGAQSGELGQSFTNPTFAATYSSTCTGATLSNTDNIDSPFALTTPFTAATLAGTFTHTTVTTTTFTLAATNGVSNPTSTLTFMWNPRIFGGVGTAGATSTVTASGTTAVLSTTDVLPSAGLGAETVGQVIGTFTPSGQAVYLLLTGGTHTFIDVVSGFPFAFNAPTAVTFTNQYGTVVSMFLYQSTNNLTGTFQPKVVT